MRLIPGFLPRKPLEEVQHGHPATLLANRQAKERPARWCARPAVETAFTALPTATGRFAVSAASKSIWAPGPAEDFRMPAEAPPADAQYGDPRLEH